jgi:4-alpha-glucanotransferase
VRPALRSQRNWGIGDFTDLKALAEIAARLGADLIGLNPLHAGFLDGSPSESPYSPASRLFLSPLYIDVTEVPELERCEEAKRLLGSAQFGDRLAACRDAELIDYGAIALLKLPVLNWGLPPFDPHALRADGFARFIELIRSNMQHAGALRIDHAMGLEHLYWVAKGSSPEEAAYVTYPFDALVGIIALESVRHRCLVIGEDLGTVPPGFRERMLERGILSYRILFFEQHEDGRLLPPENYPRLALAAVGSHDLAPLKGWWEGRDIELKLENQLYPSDAAYREQLERRRRDRELLLETLGQHGIEVAAGLTSESPFDASLAIAAHAFLARTSAALAAVQVEDLLEERELVNLPGCAEGYPNWRRRQSVPLETLESRPLVTVLASLLDEIRPYSSN